MNGIVAVSAAFGAIAGITIYNVINVALEAIRDAHRARRTRNGGC